VSFSGGGGSGTTASANIMPTGQVGTAIASYSGRVWIANKRNLNYTAPGTWCDFATADAAGTNTFTDGFLREKIYALQALNNYLYVFGDSAIYTIGDLKVTDLSRLSRRLPFPQPPERLSPIRSVRWKERFFS